MSGAVGQVRYSDPRAVMIKMPVNGSANDTAPHSAVHADFNILTNSVKEANAIMSFWPDIMAEVSRQIEAIKIGLESDT